MPPDTGEVIQSSLHATIEQDLSDVRGASKYHSNSSPSSSSSDSKSIVAKLMMPEFCDMLQVVVEEHAIVGEFGG
jgi:hypothetical protein